MCIVIRPHLNKDFFLSVRHKNTLRGKTIQSVRKLQKQNNCKIVKNTKKGRGTEMMKRNSK